ncbi:MAG: glycerol-3-phosphate dehydrogenase/oxidase [Saprospiraceae bacterium]
MNREYNLLQARKIHFDICIIGGGASGAGCALDAQSRGFTTLLIESNDFCAETSSRSTKLIHGGVRYLEQAFRKFDLASLKQVRHGLKERAILLRNAPHLAHPIEILTPCFSWFEAIYYKIGLSLYDLISGTDFLPKSRWLNQKYTLAKIPGLNRKIQSSVVYYDGQFDDARYGLSLVQTASEKGAIAINHLKVIEFIKDLDGKIVGLFAEDLLKGGRIEISAKLFINACGPQADHLRKLANMDLAPIIAKSKGIHLVLDPIAIPNTKCAMLIAGTSDGRILFVIPWEGKLLVGTTDTAIDENTDQVFPDETDTTFILKNINLVLQKEVQVSQVRSAFAGIRPLLKGQRQETKELLRDHYIEEDPISGLISILGGKWTTYRLMAKDCVDLVSQKLGKNNICSSDEIVLKGAQDFHPDHWKLLIKEFAVEEDIAKHLHTKYGSCAKSVLKLGFNKEESGLNARIVGTYPFIKAEIHYAVENEMARTIADFLSRRIRLSFLDWEATFHAIPVVSETMAALLGWTEEQKVENELEFIRYINSISGSINNQSSKS